jgi:signal transduction histidine kinase
MTGQSGAAGEIALRLAEIATSSGSARERDAAMMRLLRERLAATYVACSQQITRAGKARGMRLRASDVDVINIHPILTRAARDAARAWLAAGATTSHVLDDPRFGGWQVAGCLPDGVVVVMMWPPDGDAAAGAEILAALAPALSLTLGRGTRRAQARNGGDDPRVDAAKAGFVSLVSHSLRTPLNTLTGFVEIVLDQPVGPLNDQQREFLGYARESGRALTQLIEDVMLLSRADEGTLALRYERLDVAEIAQRALRAVDATAEVKSIQLDLHVESESLTLEGDGEWLAHALAKLLENAVKFSPENSDVILSMTASDGAVHFVVSDGGPGVAPEDAERIFARFYQAERTAKTHPGGYGLGLAVAQVIAVAHGGDLWLESAPERGATFILSLPISSIANEDHRAATKIKRGASETASRPS